MTQFQEYIKTVASYTTVGRAHFFIGQTKNEIPIEECKTQLLGMLNDGSLQKEQLKPALQELLHI